MGFYRANVQLLMDSIMHQTTFLCFLSLYSLSSITPPLTPSES